MTTFYFIFILVFVLLCLVLGLLHLNKRKKQLAKHTCGKPKQTVEVSGYTKINQKPPDLGTHKHQDVAVGLATIISQSGVFENEEQHRYTGKDSTHNGNTDSNYYGVNYD